MLTCSFSLQRLWPFAKRKKKRMSITGSFFPPKENRKKREREREREKKKRRGCYPLRILFILLLTWFVTNFVVFSFSRSIFWRIVFFCSSSSTHVYIHAVFNVS